MFGYLRSYHGFGILLFQCFGGLCTSAVIYDVYYSYKTYTICDVCYSWRTKEVTPKILYFKHMQEHSFSSKHPVNVLSVSETSCDAGRNTGKFVGDHQPPNALLKSAAQQSAKLRAALPNRRHILGFFRPSWLFRVRPVVQRFYPQCSECSGRQGNSLVSGKRTLITHNYYRRRAPLVSGVIVGAYNSSASASSQLGHSSATAVTDGRQARTRRWIVEWQSIDELRLNYLEWSKAEWSIDEWSMDDWPLKWSRVMYRWVTIYRWVAIVLDLYHASMCWDCHAYVPLQPERE